MNKKWEYYESNEEKVKEISEKFNISNLLAKILVNREILKDKEIEIFLKPTRNDFYNPFLMQDMEKAVRRIEKAITTKEKVMIYGDYDADGITSIAVLKKFLFERGLKTDYYIPNRLEEGYGLNKEAMEQIARQGYTLIITVDCGVSAIQEVEICNKLGIDIIITDHHEQLEKLPNAYAIINAKRRDNTYPFRGLAGCRSSI
ncbi:MAG: DHH family phosphoesterase [Clostridia bacterium]|nr:DHH family phosphoesterase [Clostridia bacterium]